MSETETAINEVASASAAASPKAKGKKIKAVTGGAPKKPKSKPNHPPTSEMVQNAIKTLKERGGSSLQAIKKFISATYKIDADKLSPFIKKYLKSAVTGGQLVQTKGKGASGSFRLPAAKKTAINDKPKVNKKVTAKKPSGGGGGEKKSKAVAKKVAAATGAKKSTAKKPVAEKKKLAASAKSTKKVGVKSASKQKSTKPAKSGGGGGAAAKTPKAPKPKKSSGTPKKSIKK